MPRITPIPWKVLECIVLAAGFVFSRQKGSHRVYVKKGTIRPVLIPAHNKDLDPSIIKSNLDTMQMDRDTYFKLLKDCQ